MKEKGVSKGELGAKETKTPVKKTENPFEKSMGENTGLWGNVVGKRPLDRNSDVVKELARRMSKGSLRLRPVKDAPDTFETTVWRKQYHLRSEYDPVTGPEYKVYAGKAPKHLQQQASENPFANWTGGTT